MVTESQILIDYIPIFLTIFGIVFFFLYLKTKADKEAFEYSYNVARDEINIRDIRISELRREVTKCQEDYSKAKAKIKKLNRKLENMNAEHIISSSTTDSIDSSNKTQYSNSDTYNGVSRYKMKKFINDHRTSKFASSMPSNSELDSLDIMSLYMYYTLLDNVLSDDNNKDSSNTTSSDTSNTTDYPINEESETETTNSESEPSIIDKAAETINDITSPITTPVMGVVNEAFETRDKMIDTTFGTLNEINNAKNEAIMNAVSPVIDKAAEIRDSVIDGVSNTVEKIKEEAVELNHSVDNIEEISSDSESKSTYEDYSSSSSSSDNDDSYSSSSSSSYWDSDSSSDYSSSSSSSSYDSDSSWSSSSSWDSGSSSFDSGSSGGDW